jgi:hypothetical protein
MPVCLQFGTEREGTGRARGELKTVRPGAATRERFLEGGGQKRFGVVAGMPCGFGSAHATAALVPDFGDVYLGFFVWRKTSVPVLPHRRRWTFATLSKSEAPLAKRSLGVSASRTMRFAGTLAFIRWPPILLPCGTQLLCAPNNRLGYSIAVGFHT